MIQGDIGAIPVLVVLGLITSTLALLVKSLTSYRERDQIECPHCHLHFQKGVLLVGGHSLVSCPFCRRLVDVHDSISGARATKPSDNRLGRFIRNFGMEYDNERENDDDL